MAADIHTEACACLYRWCRLGIRTHGKTNDPYSLLVRGKEQPTRDVFKETENRSQFSWAIPQVWGEGVLFRCLHKAPILLQAVNNLQVSRVGAVVAEAYTWHQGAGFSTQWDSVEQLFSQSPDYAELSLGLVSSWPFPTSACACCPMACESLACAGKGTPRSPERTALMGELRY